MRLCVDARHQTVVSAVAWAPRLQTKDGVGRPYPVTIALSLARVRPTRERSMLITLELPESPAVGGGLFDLAGRQSHSGSLLDLVRHAPGCADLGKSGRCPLRPLMGFTQAALEDTQLRNETSARPRRTRPGAGT